MTVFLFFFFFFLAGTAFRNLWKRPHVRGIPRRKSEKSRCRAKKETARREQESFCLVSAQTHRGEHGEKTRK